MRERLYRSRTDRMIGGVCGGLGRWFDVDPTLIRIGFVLFTLVGGFGILLYIAMMIIVPEERADAAAAEGPPFEPGLSDEERARRWAEREARRLEETARQIAQQRGGAMIFGGILVVVGAWFLIQRYAPRIMSDTWPVLLVVLGGLFILGSLRGGSSR